MPLIQTGPLTFSPSAQSNGNLTGIPSGIVGELVVSEVLGKYSTLAKSGRLFSAYATLTAPVIFSTAIGTGGPLLWNPPNSLVDAHILLVGFSSSVVTTVAGGLGLTGNGGQTAVPTTTTPIDASGNCLVGAGAASTSAFRVGTVTAAGNRFMPFAQFHTGALTVDTTGMTWVDVGGAFVIPPSSWGSIAGSATLSTLQVSVGVIWAELPK